MLRSISVSTNAANVIPSSVLRARSAIRASTSRESVLLAEEVPVERVVQRLARAEERDADQRDSGKRQRLGTRQQFAQRQVAPLVEQIPEAGNGKDNRAEDRDPGQPVLDGLADDEAHVHHVSHPHGVAGRPR